MAQRHDRDSSPETSAVTTSSETLDAVAAIAGERLSALLAASAGISAQRQADEVAARVAVAAAGLLTGRLSSADVWIRDREGALSFVATSGRRGRPARPAKPDVLAAEAGSAGLPVQLRRARSSRLIAPIAREGEVSGLIDIRCRDGDGFSRDEVELLQILATQAAVAIENARLSETLERQATTDSLTGLYNHRYFYERLRQEFKRSARYGIPLSLLMLDLDDFESVNDRLGHDMCDQVLCEIGRVLLKQVRRDVDLAARYGGEEFAILLPNTPSLGAQVVGDRLKRTVAQLNGAEVPDGLRTDVTAAGGGERPAPIPAGPDASEVAKLVGERIRRDVAGARFASPVDDGPVGVTVSVGVATWPGDADDQEGLVAAADKALYLAKRLGKNRVESYS
jgi:diguanylate cyclase (GGDEF)-like protein